MIWKAEELTWESQLYPSNYQYEAGDPNAEWPYQKHDQTPILQPCHFLRMYSPTKQQDMPTKFIHLPITWTINKHNPGGIWHLPNTNFWQYQLFGKKKKAQNFCWDWHNNHGLKSTYFPYMDAKTKFWKIWMKLDEYTYNRNH